MGKPKITQEKIIVIMSLYESKEYTINNIIKMTGVSREQYIIWLIDKNLRQINKHDDDTFDNHLHYNDFH